MSKGSNISVGTKVRADKINAAWQSSVDGILETARLLVDAEDQMPNGDFKRMIERELRFDASVARKLISIGRDNKLGAHAHKLPASWTTLYELSQLDEDKFVEAIAAAEINPKTQRDQVKRMRNPKPVDPPATDAEFEVITESSDVANPRGEPSGEAAPAEGDSGPPPAASPGPLPDNGLRPGYPKGEDVGPAEWIDEFVMLKVRSGDHPLLFATGFQLMKAAMCNGFSPQNAAEFWPDKIPLLIQDVQYLVNFILDFENECRKRYKHGNDAPLAAE